MEEREQTLHKSERLDSLTVIQKLFGGGNRSFSAFPLRVVYMPVDESMSKDTASILISVPKKKFKRAVKRNLVKRQIREAYRKNKYLLLDELSKRNMGLVIAFVWIDNNIFPSQEIEKRVKRILLHIIDTL